jgi:hypothetical protein
MLRPGKRVVGENGTVAYNRDRQQGIEVWRLQGHAQIAAGFTFRPAGSLAAHVQKG